jgi:hypothetical protein
MEIGLWESVFITLGFSVVVIIMDEIIHARRRRLRGDGGSGKH